MSLEWKKRLVGTGLGRYLVRRRELRALRRVLCSNPEQAGFLAQDLCARELLAGLADPGKTFVDVGAHIGSVIADVRHRWPSIEVIAVEADPDKAAELMVKFPDVKFHHCAVGEGDGEVTFFIDDERPGYSSLAGGENGKGERRKVTVPMRRLDDLIPEDKQVGSIKIDVEGAELGVLRSAKKLLARCRPVIQFESGFLGANELGYSPEQLFEFLSENDYLVLVPNRVAHDGPALDANGFLESHYYPRRTLNYYAVHRERRIELRDRAREVFGILASR